jgi:hypothetical protein
VSIGVYIMAITTSATITITILLHTYGLPLVIDLFCHLIVVLIITNIRRVHLRQGIVLFYLTFSRFKTGLTCISPLSILLLPASVLLIKTLRNWQFFAVPKQNQNAHVCCIEFVLFHYRKELNLRMLLEEEFRIS